MEGKRVAEWNTRGEVRSKRGETGSEEVGSGGGLSVGLQKVNYVLVGGSLCHFFSCLSILGGKKTKTVTKSDGQTHPKPLTEQYWE